ncbi:unnamed protein product [Rodentolepis nana]|uniref:Carbam_trans_N domain-containing protein n=1 Tax=Rodentolepis nana TaxID=102285 RepID=A0A0R3TCN3_RODNA|nr:unnamed protein product [Rodentolepis nana]
MKVVYATIEPKPGYCAAQVIPNQSLTHYQDLIDDPLCDLSCMALKKYLRKTQVLAVAVHPHLRTVLTAVTVAHHHLLHHRPQVLAAVLHLPHLVIIVLHVDAVANAVSPIKSY